MRKVRTKRVYCINKLAAVDILLLLFSRTASAHRPTDLTRVGSDQQSDTQARFTTAVGLFVQTFPPWSTVPPRIRDSSKRPNPNGEKLEREHLTTLSVFFFWKYNSLAPPFPFSLFPFLSSSCIQVDAALFESGEGKDDQSSAMRELTELTRSALSVEEGVEPGGGRYSQYDVNVSG